MWLIFCLPPMPLPLGHTFPSRTLQQIKLLPPHKKTVCTERTLSESHHISQVGKEVMHFRPPDEQNEHKVTCGLAVAVLPRVLESLSTLLEAGGVKANVIVSGAGDWRCVDLTCTALFMHSGSSV